MKRLLCFVLAILFFSFGNAAGFVDFDANGIEATGGENVRIYTECIDDAGALDGGQLLNIELYKEVAGIYPDVPDMTFNAQPCFVRSHELAGTDVLDQGFYRLKAECTTCTENKYANAYFAVRAKQRDLFIDESSPVAVLLVFCVALFALRKRK